MPIYTTYLANKPKARAHQLGSCFVYFVMRNRGNDEVAPPENLLRQALDGKITWEKYRINYLASLQPEINPWGTEWMERRAHEAKLGNILLVCFEKDSTHCHRRLLAEEIAKRFGAEYQGEL